MMNTATMARRLAKAIGRDLNQRRRVGGDDDGVKQAVQAAGLDVLHTMPLRREGQQGDVLVHARADGQDIAIWVRNQGRLAMVSILGEEAVARLADKTMDISQYLVDVVGVKPAALKPNAPSVTYHDPCHLKNSLGVTAQPRAVIAAAGCALKEMTDAGTCCGCGGSFNLKHYELSKTIGGKKADNVIASGAGMVATSCPACMLQLTDMLSQKGAKIPVKHVLQLYASGA